MKKSKLLAGGSPATGSGAAAAAPTAPGIRSVCVFCGAKPGLDPGYLRLATGVGEQLARAGITLVFGGGHVGMMGAVADGALAHGGEVVGVIPQALVEREHGHRGVARLEVVPDMATRKQRMVELSDAFVALPGGLGTLDELFEVLTLKQIGYHDKPIGLVDPTGYFDRLVQACEDFVAAGFVAAREIERLLRARSIAELLALMAVLPHGDRLGARADAPPERAA